MVTYIIKHLSAFRKYVLKTASQRSSDGKLPDGKSALRFYSAFLCAIFTLFASVSPSVATEDDTGFWTTTSGSVTLRKDWSAQLDIQTRSVNDWSTLERTVIRPSVSYKLSQHHTATFGYDAHFIELPTDRLEQRAWQQWATKWSLHDLSLSARVRVEERFIEDVDDTAYRLRLGTMVSVPIVKGAWYGHLRNEYFVGLNDADGGPQKGFDQNRAFAGVSHIINDHVKAEIGYQLQHIDRGPREDLSVHQVMFSVSFR